MILASFMFGYIYFPPGWSGVEIKFTVHVALNKFKLDQLSRQKALKVRYFQMSFWCLIIDQNTDEIVLRIQL